MTLHVCCQHVSSVRDNVSGSGIISNAELFFSHFLELLNFDSSDEISLKFDSCIVCQNIVIDLSDSSWQWTTLTNFTVNDIDYLVIVHLTSCGLNFIRELMSRSFQAFSWLIQIF